MVPDLMSQFSLCYSRKPACEDPQIVAYNFFRYGKEHFVPNDKDIGPIKELTHDITANPSLDLLKQLYNCSYEDDCRRRIHQHKNHHRIITNVTETVDQTTQQQTKLNTTETSTVVVTTTTTVNTNQTEVAASTTKEAPKESNSGQEEDVDNQSTEQATESFPAPETSVTQVERIEKSTITTPEPSFLQIEAGETEKIQAETENTSESQSTLGETYLQTAIRFLKSIFS